jgi:hypothetical protein
MTRARLWTLVAGAVIAVLALAGCSGLPTSGQVQPGLPADADNGSLDVVYKPDGPRPGASPEDIVLGFLSAGSGPTDRWAVARQFLTPDAGWKPEASVTVDVGTRLPTVAADGSVTVSLTPIAQVDGAGAYASTASESTTLDFQLVKQSDGQWRINHAPDGIVLNQAVFASVFQRYSVMFFDPSWTYLVPDVRWFPRITAASRVTSAVFGGPSPWLVGSVATAVTDGITAPSSVPQSSGVAQIEIGTAAAGVDRTTLDRLLTQLEASLASAGVSEVDLTADGTRLDADRVTVAPGSTTSPLVLTATGFGALSGGTVDAIPGLSEAVLALPSPPQAIQLMSSQTSAAARLASGTVVRVDAERPLQEVDARSGLIDPAVDRLGWIWTVPRDAPGAVQVWSDESTSAALTGAWSGASSISSLAVSRDGTRIAALVDAGGRTEVWVKGIIRSGSGTPTALGGETLVVGSLPGPGRSVVWLDDATLGVLAADGEQPIMVEQPVGGPGATVAAPTGSTTIAGSGSTATVRLRDGDGVLYVKRGTNWNQTASGIVVLATQQGAQR